MLNYAWENLKSNFDRKFWLLLAIFFIIRCLSFSLANWPAIENLISGALIITFIIVYFQRPAWAWNLLLTEILLGGAGQFFQFYDISLRTIWLIIFILLYYFTFVKEKKYQPADSAGWLILFLVLILASAVIGLANGHELKLVIGDLIPFAYLLLLFPAKEFLAQKNSQQFLFKLIIVFIIGSGLWAIINFKLFSLGLAIIHQPYYNWLRDVALGKITQVTQGYYRIVFPEHLLIVPLLLLINSYWLKQRARLLTILILCLSLILALNFSRAYFLGLAVGLLFLAYRNKFGVWIKMAALNLLAIFLIFTLINFIFSFGRSLGWEIMGLRLSSLAVPTLEESSNNRLLLLKPITDLIKASPIIGSGLGQTIGFVNAQNELITTQHFDWGYLEMWVEWGLIALLTFLAMLWLTAKKIILRLKQDHALYLGLLAGLMSMLIINITSPALFHVLGIVYLVLIMSAVWIDHN